MITLDANLGAILSPPASFVGTPVVIICPVRPLGQCSGLRHVHCAELLFPYHLHFVNHCLPDGFVSVDLGIQQTMWKRALM